MNEIKYAIKNARLNRRALLAYNVHIQFKSLDSVVVCNISIAELFLISNFFRKFFMIMLRTVRP